MTIIELLPREVTPQNVHKLNRPIVVVDYDDPNKVIARYDNFNEISFEDFCIRQVRLLVEDEEELIVAF